VTLRNAAVVVGVVAAGLVAQLSACAAGLGAAHPEPSPVPASAPAPTVTVTALPGKELPPPKKQASPHIPKASVLYAAMRLEVSDGVPSGRYVRGGYGVT